MSGKRLVRRKDCPQCFTRGIDNLQMYLSVLYLHGPKSLYLYLLSSLIQ